eukprot:scaffold14083_cov73-Skeletonema_dohrnii-CCMP3373.AAC.1
MPPPPPNNPLSLPMHNPKPAANNSSSSLRRSSRIKNNSSPPHRSSHHNKKKRHNKTKRSLPPPQPPPKSATKPCPFDGLVTYCNISDELIRELSKRVPLLGDSHCSIRRIIKNNTCLHASETLFRAIVAELIHHLKSCCKTNKQIFSSEWGNWILSQPYRKMVGGSK